MSAELATAAALRGQFTPDSARDESIGPTWRQRLLVYGILSMLCVVFALSNGKDRNWDQINHQYYLGSMAWRTDLAKNYFPVGQQAYQVPYSHIPFAAMVDADWPPKLIASTLAVWQSINLWLIFEIGLLLAAAAMRPWPWIAGGTVLLAAASPMFLSQVGATFNDITTGLFVVLAYALLIRHVIRPAGGMVLAAGVSLGIAAGLKLSNAVLCPPAAVMLLFAPANWRNRLSWVAYFIVAGVLGVVAGGGVWMWRLWAEFGNPFFPYANSLFCSPDASCLPSPGDRRFLPDSWLATLWRPIEMALPDSNIYTEIPAPDVRFTAALALTAAVAALIALRGSFERPIARVSLALGAAYAASLLPWLLTTSNGRYFMPWALLVGPVCVGSLLVLGRPGGRRALAYGVGGLLLLQSVQLQVASAFRWAETDWGERWFEFQAPSALTTEPALFLLMPGQVPSYLLRAAHPASEFAGVGSAPTQGLDMPGRQRFDRLMQRWEGKMIWAVDHVRKSDDSRRPIVGGDSLWGQLDRLGFAPDSARCHLMPFYGTREAPGFKALVVSLLGEAPKIQPEVAEYLQACAVVPAPEARQRLQAELIRTDAAFAALEAKCPKLFYSVTGSPTWPLRDVLIRTYRGGEILAWVEGDEMNYLETYRGGDPVKVGSIKAPAKWNVDCLKKANPAFGGLLLEPSVSAGR